ncbi:hypothetical protein [Nocardioides sp. SYSU D00038]|uniref:hypothetical protein n=1 Tax=Nocardioides sp. SYSU D00038 TaxID=2812554 RepID=UPI00196848A9|nr:hypothetical protein [Nocardioides sp. SYSU D00038]
MRPTSVTRAIQLHWLLVGLGLLVTVLTVVREDALIRSWAEGNSRETRELLASGGVEAVRASSVTPPAFIPVAVVLFIVCALLVWVLLAFFGNGYGWARWSLATLVFGVVVCSVAGIRTDPPAMFVVFSVVSFVLELAATYFLWHRDTSAYLAGTWAAEEPVPA